MPRPAWTVLRMAVALLNNQEIGRYSLASGGAAGSLYQALHGLATVTVCICRAAVESGR